MNLRTSLNIATLVCGVFMKANFTILLCNFLALPRSQYVEAPLPFSLYDRYSMSQYVLAPVYSTAPYYQHDPYQSGNVNSHYQQYKAHMRGTYLIS